MDEKITITLVNDFHNTSTTVRAKLCKQNIYKVPLRNWNVACHKLCGIRECECGAIRGNIIDKKDQRYLVEYYDDSFVYLEKEFL